MSNQPNIHPLLQKPEAISIDYRDQLAAAYDEHVQSLDLSTAFESADALLVPKVPVKVYYYSDNDGRLSDTAPKEIDRFLQDSSKVVSALSGVQEPVIIHRDTLAQGWVTGGFDLAQTTRYTMLPENGIGNVTFLNCAPRLDERGQEGNKTNKGEPVYVAALPNGHVVSANSRYNFVHFRDMVENGSLEIYEANVQPDGTQFRSRDTFPTHTLVLANQLTQNLSAWRDATDGTIESRRALLEQVGYVDTTKKLALEDIPKLEQFSVANIDVHGNIKTTARLSELPDDLRDRLESEVPFKVEIGGVVRDARFTRKMFDRKSGEMGLSEGSSGAAWQGAAHDDGFLEISIIGGDAAKDLDLDVEALRKPINVYLPGLVAVNDLGSKLEVNSGIVASAGVEAEVLEQRV